MQRRAVVFIFLVQVKLQARRYLRVLAFVRSVQVLGLVCGLRSLLGRGKGEGVGGTGRG